MKFNLPQLLLDRKMNQSDLKRKTNIRFGTINAYYHGYIRRMNVEDIHKICDALGCDLSELIEYNHDKTGK
jgi:putative transcriptional regulator